MVNFVIICKGWFILRDFQIRCITGNYFLDFLICMFFIKSLVFYKLNVVFADEGYVFI